MKTRILTTLLFLISYTMTSEVITHASPIEEPQSNDYVFIGYVNHEDPWLECSVRIHEARYKSGFWAQNPDGQNECWAYRHDTLDSADDAIANTSDPQPQFLGTVKNRAECRELSLREGFASFTTKLDPKTGILNCYGLIPQ